MAIDDDLARLPELTDEELVDLVRRNDASFNAEPGYHLSDADESARFKANLDLHAERRDRISAEFRSRHPEQPAGWYRRGNPDDEARHAQLQQLAMPAGPDGQGGIWVSIVDWGTAASIRGWGPFFLCYQEDGYTPIDEDHVGLTWEAVEAKLDRT